VGGIECRDMVDGCPVSSDLMLYSRQTYGKIILFEWKQEAQKYIIKERNNTTHHADYCLTKLQPNYFSDGTHIEIYASNIKNYLKKYELDFRNLKKSRRTKIHFRHGL